MRAALAVALLVGLTSAVEARAADVACDTTPTDGVEPRHPYLDGDATAALAAASVYKYGHNPYVYMLYVPPGLPDGPVPLLITMHGLGGSAENYAQRSEWTTIADREHFVLAYLSGARSWESMGDTFDVEFVRDVVADIRAERCIDATRIFANGHSNGAYMGQRLACEAGDVFAAVGVLAGGEPESVGVGGPCRGENPAGYEPVPIALWHGTADSVVGYQAGRRALVSWVNRYRCDTDPIELDEDAPYGPRETYGRCNRPDVVAREAATDAPFTIGFHTYLGENHGYPDGCGGGAGVASTCAEPGGEFPTNVDLDGEVWAFLAAHPRATPAADQPPPSATDWQPDDSQLADAAQWASDGPGWNGQPVTDLHLVDATGAPVDPDAVRAGGTILVELEVRAAGNATGASVENPSCPSTSPGSGKLRFTGRDVTLRIADANGTTELLAPTEEQAGTGLAVATFTIEPPAAGALVIEATVPADPIALGIACTMREARYQATI